MYVNVGGNPCPTVLHVQNSLAVSTMLRNVAQYAESADSAVGIGEDGRERPTCMHVRIAGARHDALDVYTIYMCMYMSVYMDTVL